MFLATLPGLVFAFATMAVVGRVFPAPSALYGLVSTVIGGGGALLLYAICARLLGIDEFRVFVRSVAGRLRRLCRAGSASWHGRQFLSLLTIDVTATACFHYGQWAGHRPLKRPRRCVPWTRGGLDRKEIP
jgi:hypothetical protein